MLSSWNLDRSIGGRLTDLKIPVVQKVFEVISPSSPGTRNRKTAVNEMSTYYGAQCVCDLGFKTPVMLCAYPSCGICTAVGTSFEKLIFDETSQRGRLGKGIYSSSLSSEADQFATSCMSSPYRVMVLCRVEYSPNDTGQNISRFTRVVVKDDRIAVADADAITPMYLIMYSMSA